MTDETPNIIAIRKESIPQADIAFRELMLKTEAVLNRQALAMPQRFKSLSASGLEQLAVAEIKNACHNTPFRASEVALVSGLSFPDIVAERYYGVEVKSTLKNHWTSTGSSIVESTRNKDVQNVYMLFGKLGGSPIEFKCRPYQDVLSEITVTHSPRYLINMQLEKGYSIFDKMGVSYDQLRTSDNSIDQVRNYYYRLSKEQGRKEMPWWLSRSDDDKPIGMTVRLWSALSVAEKAELTAQIFILFPEVLQSCFENGALWLCSVRGVLNAHMRDTFTAGGKIAFVDGERLKNPLPAVYKRLAESVGLVKELCNDDELLPFIEQFNPSLLSRNRPIYDNWLNQVEKISNQVIGTSPIRQWIEARCRFER